MREPVVVASGQTYDRESIPRWFDSGKSMCPKTGQALAVLELVPNKALKNLIVKWCRENGVAAESREASPSEPPPPPPPIQAVAANKAVLGPARMTAAFLVKKLSASSPDVANRVGHEIRMLSKPVSNSRASVGEAGAVPLLVPLLYSEDAGLQLNAVTALLNLSILEANKKRIMHAEGAVEAVAHIMGSGATCRAKENVAAAVLSLASVHTYRRRLRRNLSVVEKLTGRTSRTGAGRRARSWRPLENFKPALDLSRRKRIALGTARGMLYLHEQCDPKIIPRDIKASNVLLDKYFEAIVALWEISDWQNFWIIGSLMLPLQGV